MPSNLNTAPIREGASHDAAALTIATAMALILLAPNGVVVLKDEEY